MEAIRVTQRDNARSYDARHEHVSLRELNMLRSTASNNQANHSTSSEVI